MTQRTQSDPGTFARQPTLTNVVPSNNPAIHLQTAHHHSDPRIMGGKKLEVGGKKAAGQARKAETAAQKAAAEQAKKDSAEADEWSKGSKSNAKK